MAMIPVLGGMAMNVFFDINVEEIHMVDFLRAWLQSRRSEQGQDLAEYALLIGLIALIVILAVTFLGNEISLVFSAIATNVLAWPAIYGW
jgi:pilus assembly protein Flp/PilA